VLRQSCYRSGMTTNTILRDHKAALRSGSRAARVADLRDGRHQRSNRINSAKRYTRKAKYRDRGDS
jgi:hypothetical protein